MYTTNSFPFLTTVQVIFRDIDAMGHVNNAVYFTYMETARTQFFFQGLHISSLTQLPVILAEASCTYKSAAHFGERLFIGLGIGRIGTKSFDIVYQISAEDGRPIAEARTVMVAYDYDKEATIAIPDNLKKLLQSCLIEGQTSG